jgi:hypothetical protein
MPGKSPLFFKSQESNQQSNQESNQEMFNFEVLALLLQKEPDLMLRARDPEEEEWDRLIASMNIKPPVRLQAAEASAAPAVKIK